jgi:hypothetical protein
VQERDRIQEQAAAGTERRHQQQTGAAADDAGDEERPAPPARMPLAVRQCPGQRRDEQRDHRAGGEHGAAEPFLVWGVGADDARHLIRHDHWNHGGPLRGEREPEQRGEDLRADREASARGAGRVWQMWIGAVPLNRSIGHCDKLRRDSPCLAATGHHGNRKLCTAAIRRRGDNVDRAILRIADLPMTGNSPCV